MPTPQQQALREGVEAAAKAASAVNDKMLALALAQRDDDARALLLSDMMPLNDTWLKSLNTASDAQQQSTSERVTQASATFERGLWTIAPVSMAAAMGQLTATVRGNSESTVQAAMLASGAGGVAGKGGSVMQEVVQTMIGVDASSKKIIDIIGVIDSVAFQTNILALNAAAVEQSAAPIIQASTFGRSRQPPL